MAEHNRIYITTSIAYVNAKPHIGYALELLYADALARFYRQQGKEVKLLTGTDEHGQKIARVAEEKGISTQAYVDDISSYFQKLTTVLNITADDFIRTSSEKHKKAAQELWRRAMKSGDIEKAVYEGLYCVGCEGYKTEKDLVNGHCPIHKVAVETIKEENYFFRLSRYQERLEQWYADQEEFIIPDYRFTEIKELLKRGLEDISISRDRSKLSWGIPVPDDEDQVMYVWFDALSNYISAIGFGENDAEFTTWWPASMHIIGKDINRFHSVLWPAMLMAAGFTEQELPRQIAVHGYITVEGEKMSKSLGNVIDPFELVDKYGLEPVRYFLLSEIPFDGDGDFSYERFHVRYESELANGLGNLVSRVTNMVDKYCNGTLAAQDHENWEIAQLQPSFENCFTHMDFDGALKIIWTKIIDPSNEYIEQNKPWALAKSDSQQLERVLSQLVYALQQIPDFLQPFMPETADILRQIVMAEKITKADPLFPRLETKKE